MKMKIILLLLSMIPFYSFAQKCPEGTLNPQIDIVVQNLQIDQQKNVSQLKSLSSHNLHFPIGLYRGNKVINIEPFHQIQYSNAGACSKTVQLKLKIELTPIIYISQEAQKFRCTYDRVYEHEMTHFKIEINALNKLKRNLYDYILKKYSSPIFGSNEAELKAYLHQLNQSSLSYIYEFLEAETLPFHQTIDTPENYKNEAKKCSHQENVSLTQLLGR